MPWIVAVGADAYRTGPLARCRRELPATLAESPVWSRALLPIVAAWAR